MSTVPINVVATGNFSGLMGELNKFRSQLKALKLPDNVTKGMEASFNKLETSASKFQNQLTKGVKTKGDFSKLISSARQFNTAMDDVLKKVNSVNDKQINIAIKNNPQIQQMEQQLNKILTLEGRFKNFGTSQGVGALSDARVGEIEKLIGKTSGLKKRFESVGTAFKTGNIEQMTGAIDKLIAHVQNYKSQLDSANPGRSNAIISWANECKQAISGTVQEVDRMRASLNQMKSNSFNQMKGSLDGISAGLSTATNNMRNFVNAQTQAASKTAQLNDQVSLLRTQANYFFGLQNMGRLVTRGIKQAAESVKDLDKAMTATAVVTPYTVKDMWDMLPEYTDLANKLGATTQGAYETMTLYFQQGLNKQQTFEIGEETMKMARIAGLDYAQTTNMMTAALRGFNMELNRTSAQRVNDVYSKLAAITASDTRELGLAMERTASIANSAGMDFGNTAAFLAQMIETTREAPENLGTAMKTIVARFQELKENPYTIGDVEGEEVDYNRVDKALKTIGVDLMDNRDKFRDLDEVFMEISSKWDGLSQTQQRYVATIAAGARQQSRFIAMVQNYDRLKELTDAAANSQGAAEVQFSKTLESYEAKVNKLKNAWQTFTMGLANNQAVKGFIDIIQKIISFGDKIIDIFGKIGGVFGETGKSIGQMAAAFGLAAVGFRGLRGAATMGLATLDRWSARAASGEGGIFPKGRAAGGALINTTKPERASMLQAKTGLYQAMSKSGGLSGKEIQRQIFKLQEDQRKALLKSSPGLTKALERSWEQTYKNMNLSRATQAAIKNQREIYDKAISEGKMNSAQALVRNSNLSMLAKDIGGGAGREIRDALRNYVKNNIAKDPQLQKAAQTAIKAANAKGLIGAEKGNFIARHLQSTAAFNLAEAPAQVGKLTAGMAKLSSGTGQAGQAIMGLGMAMTAAGFPAFGAAVMAAGTGLIGLGMAAEGAAVMVEKLGAALNFLKTNPILMAAAIAGTVVAGLTAGIVAHNKKVVKDTRKAGKAVADTYTKTKKKIDDELLDLQDYQEKWATWSSGVDENGLNINLEASEYQEYLDAVKAITNAHPELIKGYNSLGNAIIDNNTAIREATKLAKEEEEQAKKTYLSNGQKIVDSMKTTKRWKEANEEVQTRSASLGNSKAFVGGTYSKVFAASGLASQTQAAVEAIQEVGGKDILKQFKVTFDEAGRITEEGVENFRSNAEAINNLIPTLFENPDDEKSKKSIDDINDKIATVGETVKGLEAVAKDYSDWGWAYATEQGYDQLDANLVVPFQTAIERIAETGLDAGDFKKEIDRIGREFINLGGHAEIFEKIKEDIKEAQDQFGKDLDTGAYEAKAEELTRPLDDWIADLEGSTDKASQILREYLIQQKGIMTDITKSIPTVAEAFNTMAGEITSANKAYENWEKRNEEGDLYTAADNFRKMYEEVTGEESIDSEGKGSNRWWSAMESMLGEDYVFEKSKDKIAAHAKEINKFFEEGKEGVIAFGDFLSSDKVLNTKLDEQIFGEGKKVSDFLKIDENGEVDLHGLADLDKDHLEGFANSLGMSLDTFTALLNKARQFSDITFANVDDMRTALAASESTVAGGMDTESGNRRMYTRLSNFRQEGISAGLRPEEINKFQKKMEKSGTVFLKEAGEITRGEMSDYIKDWGISTGSYKAHDKETGKSIDRFQTTAEAFIGYFDKLGYSQDEISELYNEAGKIISDRKQADFGETYKTVHAENADPTVKAATSIDGNVSSILGVVQSIAVAMGVLSKEDKDKISEGIEKSEEDYKNLTEGKEGLSYPEAKEKLQADVDELEKQKSALMAGQSHYEEGTPEYKEYDKEIEKVNNKLKKYGKALEGAEQVTKETYEKNTKNQGLANFAGDKNSQKAVDYYKEHGFGNAPLSERGGKFGINWDENINRPKNQNLINAKTWGYSKKDLKGQRSTYMSEALGFGEGENEIQVSFTPILNKDGKASMLAKQDVEKYLDTIVTEATDKETGKINISDLMKLDKEGAEINGQQISNLIMGAFSGKNAEQISGAFGELEHIISEQLPQGSLNTAEGVISTADSVQTLCNGLTALGEDGQAAAQMIKLGFLDASSGGIQKMTDEDLVNLTSSLSLASDDINSLVAMHPELSVVLSKIDTSEVDHTKEEIENGEPAEIPTKVTPPYSDNNSETKPETSSGIPYNPLNVLTNPNSSNPYGDMVQDIVCRPVLKDPISFSSIFSGFKPGKGYKITENGIEIAVKVGEPQQPSTPSSGGSSGGNGGDGGGKGKGKGKGGGSVGVPLLGTPDVTNPENFEGPAILKLFNIPKELDKQNVTIPINGVAKVNEAPVVKKVIKKITGGGNSGGGGNSSKGQSSGGSKGTTTTNVVRTRAIAVGGAQVKSLANTIQKVKSKSVNVKASVTGGGLISSLKSAISGLKDKTVRIVAKKVGNFDTGATGINNHISHQPPIPTVGSLAKGTRYGRLGPKNRGGMTLTGEKGFEIAWLPSESRSAILGEDGPQMVSLPKDAVVYTHEQSKKIMKQRPKMAGSHSKKDKEGKKVEDFIEEISLKGGPDGKLSTSTSKDGKDKSGTGGNDKGSGSKDKDKSGKSNKSKGGKGKSAWVTVKKAGKITEYWWNMTKKVEATQRKIDELNKKIEKVFNKIGTTLQTIAEDAKKYVEELNSQITRNKAMAKKADQKLKTLDEGSPKVKKARQQYQKADKKYRQSHSKKDKKERNKAYKKYKKERKKDNKKHRGVNWASVSYDVTKRKKGSKKTKKVTKKKNVNLASYITYDKNTGAYQVDYGKINRKFGKSNKSLAKAVAEAAKKKLEDYQGKKNTAEDNITKAKDALDDFGQKVSETFYQWKNEITEIYALSKKLENLESFSDRFDAAVELELSKIGVGFGETSKTIEAILNVLDRKNRIINQQIDAHMSSIDAAQRELDDLFSTKEEEEKVEYYTNLPSISKETQTANVDFFTGEKLIAETALSYISNIFRDFDGSYQFDIDWKGFEEDRKIAEASQDPINKETYEKIKEYLDNISEKTKDFNSKIKEGVEFAKSQYEALKEYRDSIVEMEGSLLDGLEKETEEISKNAKLISDTIANTLKDLIDEVKRKLDERRKKEDNLKTETEISQKQQRLAALRADTSGGNQLEIAKLEKEIADSQQTYGRTLEDQLLDKLQNQADEATKQRERQIELLETQNELISEETKQQVLEWLKNPEPNKDKIINAWLAAKDYEDLGLAEQAEMLQEAEAAYAELVVAVKETGFDGDFDATEDKLGTLVSLVKQLTDKVIPELEDKNGKSILDVEKTVENARKLREKDKASASTLRMAGFNAETLQSAGYTGEELHAGGFKVEDLIKLGYDSPEKLRNIGFTAKELKKSGIYDLRALSNAYTAKELHEAGYGIEDYKKGGFGLNEVLQTEIFSKDELLNSSYKEEYAKKKYDEFLYNRGDKNSKDKNKGKVGVDGYKQQVAYGKILGLDEKAVATALAKTDELSWKTVLTAVKKAKLSSGKQVKQWYPNSKKGFKTAFEKVFGKWTKFESGGIANFTGPAWLDGTPSKPELVLNSQDTKNFMALKDVLGKSMKSIGSASSVNENNNFNININVDQIANDYDVDRMVARVKKEITKSASYRNVSQVRNFR